MLPLEDVFLENAKVLERAWFLLTEISVACQFDASGLCRPPKSLPSNWLLAKALLDKSVISLPMIDPFEFSKHRHELHQHIRSLFYRLGHFSEMWSSSRVRSSVPSLFLVFFYFFAFFYFIDFSLSRMSSTLRGNSSRNSTCEIWTRSCRSSLPVFRTSRVR